jgi:hypothetical protein
VVGHAACGLHLLLCTWISVVGMLTRSALYEKPKHVLHFLSLLHRPDDDPDKGRNIVAKAKYICTW